MTSFRTVFVGLLFMGGLLASNQAVAQSCEDPARASKLAKTAKRLVKEGRTPEALMKLKRAYQLCEHPAILVSIANRYVELEEPEKANEALSKIQNPNARLRRHLKDVRKKVEALLARPVPVSIRATPSNAMVSIDGGPFRALPAELSLARGTRRFRFKASGRKETVLVKTLSGLRPITVNAVLPVPNGQWRVTVPGKTLQNVRILFNGRLVQMDANERAGRLSRLRSVAPGAYSVTCLMGVDDVATAKVVVKTNATSVATCKFAYKGPSAKAKIIGWSGVGLAGVSLLAGVGILASYSSDVENYPPPRYKIESSKPAAGGTLIGTSVVLGVVSSLILTQVIKF